MERNLQFLSGKLLELRTGLFINQSDAVLKINAAIINLIKVDDAGQLWFFIPKPLQHLSEFEKIFSGKMHFYQKGKNFFIKMRGKAFIIDDPEEITGLVEMEDAVKKTAMTEKVLIKVRIEEVDYYETRKKEKVSFLHKIPMHLQHLMFHPRKAYRPYRFNQQAIA